MKNKDRKSVKLGTQVEILLIYRSGQSEKLKFDLVEEPQADIDRGYLGVSTPLAKAILGENAGTRIPFFTTELLAVEILSVFETARQPDIAPSLRRTQSLKNTLDRIEFRDAVLFASSTDTKWGQYDADGLDYHGWQSNDPLEKDNGEEEGK